jgi:heme-degrading monooxygenase HmoA
MNLTPNQQELTEMIARLWSARTTPALASEYLGHFSKHVQPMLRTFGGYAGSTVMTREASEMVEIVVTTLWRSLQAIEAFAGPDLEAAVVTTEAAALLTSFDRRAVHYELALFEFPRTTYNA